MVQQGRLLRANASSKHMKNFSGGVEVREELWVETAEVWPVGAP